MPCAHTLSNDFVPEMIGVISRAFGCTQIQVAWCEWACSVYVLRMGVLVGICVSQMANKLQAQAFVFPQNLGDTVYHKNILNIFKRPT